MLQMLTNTRLIGLDKFVTLKNHHDNSNPNPNLKTHPSP